MEFEKRYSKLNTAQKQAVDNIDGPVMVIAGPGTGKTELLSVRVANILKQTDTIPENILCLTFTDNGANEMRERLIGIIGRDAYKVAVHTFHSFGSEVINQNGQYFYQGAHFRPADNLSSYEIIRSIFEKLPHNNLLSRKMNDEYTYLKDSLKAISNIKKSGFTSDELLVILDENDIVIDKVENLLRTVFIDRVSNATIDKATKIIEVIKNTDNKKTFESVVPLSIVIADSLENAIDESTEIKSTKPMTAWKSKWLEKNEKNELVLKSRDRQKKLRALCHIYNQYLQKMHQAELYDFDDMILRVVHAMEIYNELRLNLQEKYQYILVDEFQDTNMAQMRILHNLTNNYILGDTPNIMVVGDDDQAIYSFQGADVSNILNFKSVYPKTKIIALKENYRSTSTIVEGSREIISQGKDRLENYLQNISKEQKPQNLDIGACTINYADNISNERYWLIDDIKKQIKSGINPSNIAVLTRKHDEINQLLPYFSNADINISYERQDDALSIAPVKLIEKISRMLLSLSEGKHNEVDSLLPGIMTHPAFGFDPIKLCKLSIDAYDSHNRWLDIISKNKSTSDFYKWVVQLSSCIAHTPLEQVLDIIIGNPKSDLIKDFGYTSPLHEYFFSQDNLQINPSEYLTYLEALRTIRTKLREYRPDQTPTLKSFTDFIDLNNKIGNKITSLSRVAVSDNAINLMTAHKSKGLEFEVVYIVNAVDEIWGEKARGRNSLIGYPENLPLSPAGNTLDERLRLFYVAITRAKSQLHISYSLHNESGKSTLPVSFLTNSLWQQIEIPATDNIKQLIELAEVDWYHSITNIQKTTLKDLLAKKIQNYKLSVTHLNNFLDIKNAGPKIFLIQNLLHFPSAKSSSASFGTAIHDTLCQTHEALSATGKKQAIEDILANFEKNLSHQNLSKSDFELYLQKGFDVLQKFLDEKYKDFSKSQLAEVNFVGQSCIVKDALITGKIDVINVNNANKTATVTDYKTGKTHSSWLAKTDSDKIKLHKYKQQLMFYDLLIKKSRDFHRYTVEPGNMQFVEPSANNEINSLTFNYDDDEINRFSKLVEAVWKHIIQLNLPDVTKYEPNYKGVLNFEQDLIDNII